MANYYYNNGTSNALWNTVANWFLDSDYLIPAGSLPTPSDDVFIDGALTTGPSVAVSLASITCGSILTSAFNVNLGNATTGGSYEFYNNVTHTGTSVVGGYYFYGNSINSGIVDSNNVSSGFFDSSENSGTAYSVAEFNNNSTNTGTCDSTASFSDSSHNLGTVISTATFYDLSYNSGTVNGDAIFNTFTSISSNIYEDTVGYGTGTVNGGVLVSIDYVIRIEYINNDMLGYIIPTSSSLDVVFNNNTNNQGTVDILYAVQFLDSSYNNSTGIVENNAEFNDTSYNIGTVGGDAEFNYITSVIDGIADDITGYSSGEVGGVVRGDVGQVITTWRITNQLRSDGTCQGNAIFIGFDTYNNGTVIFDASFYGGSINNGAVEGTTFIYDDSRNTGTVEDIVYKSSEAARLAIQNSYIGTINGTVSLPFADILGTGLQ
jgi:hypothetical protein